MSRRAADQQRQSVAMGHGQQAIWEEIRRLKSFTITDLWNRVDMHRKSIINYVKRLEAGGIVEQAADFKRSYKYRLVRDTGRHAPRVQRDGTPVVQGAANDNLWRSMRMMKQFTPLDLATHSTTDTVSVAETTAKSYCTMLLKAGYLRVTQKANPFQARQATYRLVRNTGPLPPQIQRVKQVFDPNLNEVTYTPGVTP